jgi:steroid delta-isomerase-like uncharacterized protein
MSSPQYCSAAVDKHGQPSKGERMQSAKNSSAAAPVMTMSTDVLIELQRRTVAEHIEHEQTKDWPEVYRTFTPHEEDAYYDVVPFQMRFPKMKGVVDFYETFTKAFPDFRITVHTENDVPGVSVREVQITGTHTGEYCGLEPTGRKVSVALIGLFLFDVRTGHLNAERIYFDNNTILAQLRGEMAIDQVFDLSSIGKP